MVSVVSALLLLTATQSPREQLIAADRAATRLADALAEDVLFLHPRAPLLRGRAAAGPFADSLSHTPVFAAVSADERFGYTWGGTRRDTIPGKYLACWRRDSRGWVIIAFVHRLSADSGAPVAFVAYAASDGVSLPGGAPIRFGREAIRAAFADWPAGATLDWAPIWGDAAAAGDLGCTVGLAEFKPGTSPSSYSKYVTVWRREADGTWKFAVDAGNSRPAPPR